MPSPTRCPVNTSDRVIDPAEPVDRRRIAGPVASLEANTEIERVEVVVFFDIGLATGRGFPAVDGAIEKEDVSLARMTLGMLLRLLHADFTRVRFIGSASRGVVGL